MYETKSLNTFRSVDIVGHVRNFKDALGIVQADDDGQIALHIVEDHNRDGENFPSDHVVG
jgi:hypothetical protein